jgi:hypothetical protein
MTSSAPGATISPVEVGNIDRFGVWLLVYGREHFLPHPEYPWFEKATITQILNVVMEHEDSEPDLDVDLSVDSLDHPEGYPLGYR